MSPFMPHSFVRPVERSIVNHRVGGAGRAAILVALVVATLQAGFGVAETATSYDHAEFSKIESPDLMGGGALSVSGAADQSGLLSATSTAASDAPAGAAALNRSVGANEGKAITSLYKEFVVPESSDLSVNVTLDILSLMGQSETIGASELNDVLTLNPAGSPPLASNASSWLAVRISANFGEDYVTVDPANTSQEKALSLGENTISLAISGTGLLRVHVQLEAYALASGSESNAAAGCMLLVKSIDVLS